MLSIFFSFLPPAGSGVILLHSVSYPRLLRNPLFPSILSSSNDFRRDFSRSAYLIQLPCLFVIVFTISQTLRGFPFLPFRQLISQKLGATFHMRVFTIIFLSLDSGFPSLATPTQNTSWPLLFFIRSQHCLGSRLSSYFPNNRTNDLVLYRLSSLSPSLSPCSSDILFEAFIIL